METDRSYLARASTVSLLGLVAKVAGPTLTILLARVFSRECFGLFLSLQLFAYSAAQLANLGLDRGLVWYVGQNEREGRPSRHGLAEILTRAHLQAAVAAALCILFVAAGGLGETLSVARVSWPFLVLCCSTTFFLAGMDAYAGAFEGIRRPEHKIFVNDFLAMTAMPVFAFALLWLGLDCLSLPAGFFAANLVALGVMAAIGRRRFGPIAPSLGPVERRMWSYSIPLGIGNTVAGVLLRLDLWMILFFIGPEMAAVYGIMVTLANGVKAIRQTYDSLIVPVVSRMAPEDRAGGLREAHSYVVNVVTALQLPVAVALLFFPREILSIAGRDYSLEPKALAILIAGNLLNGFLAFNGQILAGLGKSRLLLAFNVVALGVNFVANALLIPRFGLVGAATGTNIAYLVQCGLMYGFQRRHSGCSVYEPHLWANGLLIALFALSAFLFQDAVDGLSLGERLAAFALVSLALGAVFALKRRTFRARSPGAPA